MVEQTWKRKFWHITQSTPVWGRLFAYHSLAILVANEGHATGNNQRHADLPWLIVSKVCGETIFQFLRQTQGNIQFKQGLELAFVPTKTWVLTKYYTTQTKVSMSISVYFVLWMDCCETTIIGVLMPCMFEIHHFHMHCICHACCTTHGYHASTVLYPTWFVIIAQ